MRVGAPEEAKILVVEDHPRGRRLVVDLLAAEGYTVLQAESGVGLLDRVKRERPNMILLDLQLPEIDGLTLARQLKADPETQIIPLLAITAYAQPEDHAKALAAGFAEYLTKPLDTERFIQTVGRVLGR
jgi:CheY-like chemotaxis protein